MLFGEIDLDDYKEVLAYFQDHYPRLAPVLGSFRLMSVREMRNILDTMETGTQITFHAFPGQHIYGNAYAFPRFLRIEGAVLNGDKLFRVTREKAIRDRLPALMLAEEVIQYYYELADITYLQAEEEIRWAAQWPPEKRFPR